MAGRCNQRMRFELLVRSRAVLYQVGRDLRSTVVVVRHQVGSGVFEILGPETLYIFHLFVALTGPSIHKYFASAKVWNAILGLQSLQDGVDQWRRAALGRRK